MNFQKDFKKFITDYKNKDLKEDDIEAMTFEGGKRFIDSTPDLKECKIVQSKPGAVTQYGWVEPQEVGDWEEELYKIWDEDTEDGSITRILQFIRDLLKQK